MIGEKAAFCSTVLILPQTYSKELRRTSKVTGSSRLPLSFEVFIGTPLHGYGQIALSVDHGRTCRCKRGTRMLVLDYRGPFDLASRAQSRGIVERGPDRFAVENNLALALDHVSSIALPGARGNSLHVARSVPGNDAQRGHAQADEGRMELLRRDTVFAQMRLVKIRPDFVERRSDVIRNWRQNLIAL